MTRIASVAVEGTAFHFDKPYSYLVPQLLNALPGARVVIPFGRGEKTRIGIILAIENATDEESINKKLKSLLSVIDIKPLILSELLELAMWIRAQTFCTLFEACRLMLPAGLNARIITTYSINPDAPKEAFLMLTSDEKRITDMLSKKSLTREKLLEALGLDKENGLADELTLHGLLQCEEGTSQYDGEASVRMVRLNIESGDVASYLEGAELTKKQKNALKTVFETGSATVKEVCYYSGVTSAIVNALVKKDILCFYEHKIYRNPYKNLLKSAETPPELSNAQQRSFDNLIAQYNTGKAAAALLFGVTGSGKTQVFMKLIERVRADKKGVIVLVPEISLTPQAVSRFYARFGADVAVLHSGLSVGERLDEWQRVFSGSANIVVGTRSAIFAPINNLGAIIIDEEQEHTYKSESSPRYHARDAARFRCAKSGALLVFASATPSVESFYAAKTDRYSLTRLDERFGEAVLPQVITVDMKIELSAGNDSPVSSILLAELRKNIERGEQSILLLNRRGYNTFVSCVQCGNVISCPNCSISMTYHQANGRLMCHYCGYSVEGIKKCPVCESHFMRYAGNGTQKAEQLLSELLPDAKILRMDTDTTTGKYAHEKLLRQFDEEKYDILVGTQMVAKGLDFPNVTLVGVLSADQSLYMDDFRSAERTFSLLTQVIGRSGRGSLSGRAVIQTSTPENEVIKLSALQDYDAFYNSEIELRKALLYPPFCDICEIGFSGLSEIEVKRLARAFYERLKELAKNAEMPSRIMEPSPAAILKISNRFRYKIIIKCKSNKNFRAFISKLLVEFGSNKLYNKSAIFADINPMTVM